MTDSDALGVAEVLLTQGDMLRSQGRDTEAERLYLRALSIFERTSGAQDVQVAEACLRLADLNRFFDLDPEAVPLYQRALTIFERAPGPANLRVADVLVRLGDVHWDNDWVSTSAQMLALHRNYYKRALDIIENGLKVGQTLADARPDLLAAHYEVQGRYVDSESLHRWTLKILTEELGPDHLRVAAQMLRLGRFCWGRGRFEEAMRLLRDALDIAERVLGPEHPGLRRYLHELADHSAIFDFREIWSLGASRGQRTPRMDIAREKETLHLRALAIAEKRFGKDHPAVVRDLMALEFLHRELERDGEVAILHCRTLAIIDRVGPDKRRWAVDTLLRLRMPLPGHLSADADALFQRARTLAERGIADDTQGDILFQLAQLCLQEGRPSEAQELFARARALAERAFGTGHPRVACLLFRTGLGYYGRETATAQRYYDEALDILKGSSSIDDPRIADDLLNYADAYQIFPRDAEAFGQIANEMKTFGILGAVSLHTPVKTDPPPCPDIEPLLHILQPAFEKGLGRDRPLVGRCLLTLGDLRVEQGAMCEAEHLFLHALAIAEKSPGDGHGIEVGSLSGLAMLYHFQKKYADAEPLYRRWIACCEQHPDPQEITLLTPLFNLARCLADQGRRQEIEPLFRRARGIVEARRESFGVNVDYDLLMRFYRLLSRAAEAEALARQELSSMPWQRGPSWEKCIRDLAESCQWQGDFAEAERLYRKALADCETDLGPDGGTRVSPFLIGLARVYHDQGMHADAESLLRRAINILEGARHRDREENGWLLNAMEDYLSLLRRVDRAAEAREAESRVVSVKAQVDADRERRNRQVVRGRLPLDWDVELA